MSGLRVSPATNSATAQGKVIERVPDQSGVFISPSMAHDVKIVPNIAKCHDHLLRPGLRLNPEAWEQYESEKKT